METSIQQQAAIVRNQARIIDLLQWSPDDYSELMYNNGIDFLQAYIGQDPHAIDSIAPRIEFWNWWKSQWNERDELFVWEMDGKEYTTSVEEFRKVYRIHNNAGILACEIHPPRVVYGNKFTEIKMAAV